MGRWTRANPPRPRYDQWDVKTWTVCKGNVHHEAGGAAQPKPYGDLEGRHRDTHGPHRQQAHCSKASVSQNAARRQAGGGKSRAAVGWGQVPSDTSQAGALGSEQGARQSPRLQKEAAL